ncbi:MAG TPA: T9SS type A sorting domain-containing protein, partial [Chitinophagales bacterium]|nr:T9SS type A sorting domain-containing protein [Chitinophagales bacterium]
FCCQLGLHVHPYDTLYYQPGAQPVCLSANVENSNGTARLKWCGISCLSETVESTMIELQPDTNLRYVGCIAYEEGCQAVTLNMVKEGTPVACETFAEDLSHKPLQVRMRPQPASEVFFLDVKFPEVLNELVRVEIFDVTGRSMLLQEIFATDSIRTMVNVKQLKSGSYWVKISSDKFRYCEKLVII